MSAKCGHSLRWQSSLTSRAGRRDGEPLVLRRRPELQPSPEDEDGFDLVFGRFDIDNAGDDMQDCLFDLRWRGKMLFDKLFDPAQGDLPFDDRIVFDFMKGKDIAARVRPPTGPAGVHHVGLSLGLVARLYRAGYALMSMADVFPNLGNSREETASDREVAACLFEPVGKIPLLPARGRSPLPSAAFADLVPIDWSRHFMAHAMVGVGLQWLYYHEFHHVWAGHLRLAQSRKPRNFFGFSETEFAENSIGAIESVSAPGMAEQGWFNRLIEFDADKRAARRMVDAIANDRVMLNAINLSEDEKGHLVGCWALMLCSLLIILNSTHGDDVKASGRYYPHPEVRFWGAFRAFQDLLPEKGVAPYHKAIQETHRVLRRLWTAAGRKGDSYSNSRSRIELVVEEANRLAAAVNNELYPALLPYDVDQFNLRRKASDGITS